MELPIGTHLEGDFNVLPDQNWIFANGTTLDRDNYATYFALITRTVATSLTSESATATVSSSASLAVGMKVEGTTLLPAGTEIISISGTTITFSNNSSDNLIDADLNYIDSLAGFGDGSVTFTAPDWSGRTSVASGEGSGLTNKVKGASGGNEKTNSIPAFSGDPTTSVQDPAPTLNLGSAIENPPFGAGNPIILFNATENTTISGDSTEGNLAPYGVVKRIIKVL